MKRSRFVAAVVLAALAAAACGGPGSTTSGETDAAQRPVGHAATSDADPAVDRAPPDSRHVETLTAGLNGVGYDLFRIAASDSDADVVISPLSVGIAFGMADAGATGTPAAALEKLFAYPVDGEARWSAFNGLEQSVTDVGEPVVRLANRMYTDEAFQTAEGYAELLARWFGAGAERLPLRTAPERSRARINDWVARRTERRIPELLPAGFVNDGSVMVLVNALYLQADWARPFGKYPTKKAPFTRRDGSTVVVPLMHELELSGPAVAADDYVATEVPYEGDELSMLVIVPAAGRYDEVEVRLDGDLVAEIDAAATTAAVELWLPRFDSDATLDLREAIEDDLGIEALFGVPGWDGIGPGVTLEQAVHAADISVDENGTVAAAATGLGFEESGPPKPDITVRADRPFVYLIRHLPTGAVLFVGRVLDPLGVKPGGVTWSQDLQ